jgi:hypothetical protein
VHEPNDQQQDHRPDGGVDDRRHKTGAEMDAELRQQPAADKCADNSNDEIADNTKPGALHDLPGQPPSNQAYQQYDQKTFGRDVIVSLFRVSSVSPASVRSLGKRGYCAA